MALCSCPWPLIVKHEETTHPVQLPPVQPDLRAVQRRYRVVRTPDRTTGKFDPNDVLACTTLNLGSKRRMA
jgi:hypothetical protein